MRSPTSQLRMLNTETKRWLLLLGCGWVACSALLARSTGVACDPPFNIRVVQATLGTLTVDWTVQNAPPESAWDVHVLPHDAPPPLPGDTPTHPGVGSRPYIVPGLQAGTAYRIYVRALCGGPGAWTIAPAVGITRLNGTDNCGLDLPIPNDDCHVFELEVSNQAGTALGTDVTLDRVGLIVEHEWDSDLDMHLIAPDGTRVRLAADNGSGQDNYGDPTDATCTQRTVFFAPDRPGACQLPSIEAGSPPFIGHFLPEESLAAFRTGGSPNGIWQLEICDDAPDHTGSLRHVQLLFDATACVAPVDVRVVLADSTSLLLDWSAGSACATTLVEYGPPGFVPGTGVNAGQGQVSVVGCPGATLAGLAANTDYDLYLRSLCADGSYTLNSCPVRTATTCSPGLAAQTVDFESEARCAPVCGVACPLVGPWQNSVDDQFDWLVHTDSTPSANTGPGTGAGGSGQYLYLESSAPTCQSGRRAVLLSDCIAVQSRANGCDFSFDYHMFGSAINSLRLEVTTDGGLNWTPVFQLAGVQDDRWRRAYVGLGNYNNQTIRLRFVGRGGGNAAGDIGLDNLVLYGGAPAGPATTFYRDNDGDGYGVDGLTLESCGSQPPAGFSALGGDCRDDSFGGQFINPGTPEVGCDGIDNNCNGMADDADLPGPAVSSDTICGGAIATLSGSPGSAFGELYWYATATASEPFYVGNTLVLTPQADDTLRVDSFYVAERVVFNTIELCASTSRSLATLHVLPQPAITIAANTAYCGGELVDLTAIDLTSTGAPFDSLRVFLGASTEPADRIFGSVIFPSGNLLLTYQAIGAAGCSDTAQVQLTMLPTPAPQILGADTLCRGIGGYLSVSASGYASTDLTYRWNTGADTSTISVSGPPGGGAQAYGVTVTADNGCSGRASLTLSGAPAIQEVDRQIQAVSNCNGSNGSIALEVTGGQPPFGFAWVGPVSGSAVGGTGYTIENLPQGTYTVTITDGSVYGCSFVLPNNAVSGPSAVIETVVSTLPTCPDSADGCLAVEFSGGSPNFLWSDGQTGATACGLAAGLYSVTVTEGNCVTVLDELRLGAPETLAASNELMPPRCAGASDGSITLLPTGGTAPYSGSWSDGTAALQREDLPAGPYAPTLTDANGCTLILDTLRLSDPSPLGLSVLTNEAVTCNGQSDGQLQVTGSGGTAPYRFTWADGNPSGLRQGLAAGAYAVTVTDTNDCFFTQQLSITQPDSLRVTFTAAPPSCVGVDDGQLGATITGGNDGYTYTWSDGYAGGLMRSNLAPGSYGITVVDARGCSAARQISLEAPVALQLGIDTSMPSCTGVADGSISLAASGGTPHYTYFLNDSPTGGASLTQLPGGNYRLRAVDQNGCEIRDSVTLVDGQPFNFTFSTIAPSCFGEPGGQVLVQPAGGTPNYSFLWSNGATTEDLNAVAAGAYQLSVTDAVGCELVSDTLRLSAPAPIRIVTNAVDSLDCSNAAVGQIDLGVSGGTAPYEFMWNTGTITEDLTGLGAGSYYLQVRDGANCFAFSDTIVLNEFPPVAFTYNEADNPADPCSSSTVDSIILQPLSGQAPFRFLWNDGDTSAVRTQLPSGEYSVTVTDARGCTDVVEPVKIPDFIPNLQVSLPPPADTLGFCVDAFTLQAVISGGNAPYQYNWSMGQVASNWPTDTVPGIVSETGQYRVTITDANGCQTVAPAVPVTFAAPLQLSYAVEQIPCFGGDNGGIDLTVSAGSAPYQYAWANAAGDTVSTQQDPIDQLGAGTYRVTVTDASGCAAASLPLVIDPPPAQLMLPGGITQDPVDCFGGANGSLSALPDGGTPPYQYSWTQLPPGADPVDVGGNSPVLPFLEAGTYRLRVIDANNCLLVTAPVDLLEPDSPLVIDSARIEPPRCADTDDGSVTVWVSGGWGGYAYEWFGFAATDSTLSGLGTGTYQVEINDAEGCRRISPFYTIDAPDQLSATAELMNPSPGQADGGITLFPAGGTPPYQYAWADTPTADSTRQGLEMGEYVVTLTDAQGCDTTLTLVLESANASLTGGSDVRLHVGPNPTDGPTLLSWTTPTPYTGYVQLLDAFGHELDVRTFHDQSTGRLSFQLEDRPAGVYHFIWRTKTGVVRTRAVVKQ